jgi:hypothetical protein
MNNYDPLDIKAQERSKSDRDLQERVERESEESDVRWLMGNKRGRRILWRLLDQSGVFRSSFNTNAMAMAFAEGNRNYGLRTLAMIHALCPEQYATMMKEQTNV